MSVRDRKSIFPGFDRDMTSPSLPLFLYHTQGLKKSSTTYRDRQKDYRLSDLVVFGPEYYRHVFNLPHQHSQDSKRYRKTMPSTELDRIKQDLFHRYLWTRKPQVSCRIRPLSTYSRTTTFVI